MGERKKLLPISSKSGYWNSLLRKLFRYTCHQAFVYGEDVISIDHRTDFRRGKAVKEKI